ncbi:MAG: hypothetical protein QXI38_02515 [Conexivisphaerales archaeon]
MTLGIAMGESVIRKIKYLIRSKVVKEFLNDPNGSIDTDRGGRTFVNVSTVLDAGIFNEIMAIFTYNVVEAHRGGTRVSWTKGTQLICSLAWNNQICNKY